MFIFTLFILFFVSNQMTNDYKEATNCVVSGYNPGEHKHAANPPIYLTSTFEFDTA